VIFWICRFGLLSLAKYLLIFCLPLPLPHLTIIIIIIIIIIMWNFRKWDVGVCTESSWLRIETGGRHV
jgi:hypothetical protein